MPKKLRIYLISISLIVLSSSTIVFAHLNTLIDGVYYSTDTSGNFDIYYQDADSAPYQLTTDSKHNQDFDISPDGEEIVYMRYLDEIAIMNIDAGEISSRPLQQGYHVVNPQFSPDGEEVVFAKGTTTSADIYIIHKDSGPADSPSPVTLNDCSGDVHPNWSPRGDMIVFGGTLPGVCSYHWEDQYLTIINKDGSNRRVIYDAEFYPDGVPLLGSHSFFWKEGDDGEQRIIFGQGQENPICCHQKLLMATFTLNSDPLSNEPIFASVTTVVESFPPDKVPYVGHWDKLGNIWFVTTDSTHKSGICAIDVDNIHKHVRRSLLGHS